MVTELATQNTVICLIFGQANTTQAFMVSIIQRIVVLFVVVVVIMMLCVFLVTNGTRRLRVVVLVVGIGLLVLVRFLVAHFIYNGR